MFKKIIIITLVILIALLGVWIFVYVKQAKEPAPIKNQTATPQAFIPITDLKTGETKNISKVLDDSILYSQIIDSKVYYFNSDQNKILSFNLENQARESLNIDLENKNVSNIVFYPEVKKLVISILKEELLPQEREYSNLVNGPLEEKIIYDLETKNLYEIKDYHYLSFILSPDNRIIYYYFDNEKEENKILQEDMAVGGLSRKTLVDLGKQETPYFIEFYGIKNNKLYYSKVEDDGKSVFSYDLATSGERKILSNINRISFDPDARKIFYSLYDDRYYFLYDIATDKFVEAGEFDGDFDYILWQKDKNYFYYFVGDLEGEKEDSYLLAKELWKFDFDSAEKEKIKDLAGEGNIGMSDAFIFPDEQFLYFTNAVDLNLYKIAIK